MVRAHPCACSPCLDFTKRSTNPCTGVSPIQLLKPHVQQLHKGETPEDDSMQWTAEEDVQLLQVTLAAGTGMRMFETLLTKPSLPIRSYTILYYNIRSYKGREE